MILVAIVCGLLVAERNEGLWTMIYATSGGQSRLALRRVGILLGASWIATVVLVGMRILLCGWVYHGLGEWDRPLQSIQMFYNVPTPMTVGQFWLVYMTVKAFGAFWVGLVLWTILSAISNLALALGHLGCSWEWNSPVRRSPPAPSLLRPGTSTCSASSISRRCSPDI